MATYEKLLSLKLFSNRSGYVNVLSIPLHVPVVRTSLLYVFRVCPEIVFQRFSNYIVAESDGTG